jgi:hypothetical protein
MLPKLQLEKLDTVLVETGAIIKSLLASQDCCVRGQHVWPDVQPEVQS